MSIKTSANHPRQQWANIASDSEYKLYPIILFTFIFSIAISKMSFFNEEFYVVNQINLLPNEPQHCKPCLEKKEWEEKKVKGCVLKFFRFLFFEAINYVSLEALKITPLNYSLFIKLTFRIQICTNIKTALCIDCPSLP